MEYVAVLGKDNEVMQRKPRSKITIADRIRVAAVWLVHKDRVLFAQRSEKKKTDPGLWGPSAAGVPTYKESVKTCARRETAEEIGVVTTPTPLETQVFYESRIVTWFKAEWDEEPLTLQESEVEAVQWVAMRDVDVFLDEHDLVEGTRDGIRFLREYEGG
jgi:isopentenyldiphosphate isomerase